MSKPVLAIDMGGTKIKIGLVQEETVLSYISIDAESEKGLAPKLPLIKRTIEIMLAQHNLTQSDISGLGIASRELLTASRKKFFPLIKSLAMPQK